MRLGLLAMSGVRVIDPKLAWLGVTLPQFVARGHVVASLPSLSLLTIAALTPEDVDIEYVEIPHINDLSTRRLPDYDAVAMLNVSATQELYRLLMKQQEDMDDSQKRISELRGRVIGIILYRLVYELQCSLGHRLVLGRGSRFFREPPDR